MPRAIPKASYIELAASPPMVSAQFAARYFGIGRDRVRPMIERGTFPVDVIRTGTGRYVIKTALLHALGITPNDLRVLAQMEREAQIDGFIVADDQDDAA